MLLGATDKANVGGWELKLRLTTGPYILNLYFHLMKEAQAASETLRTGASTDTLH
jgi:hypothetical protein